MKELTTTNAGIHRFSCEKMSVETLGSEIYNFKYQNNFMAFFSIVR